MSWLLKNSDASAKAERGSEESALSPETAGKEGAGGGKYAAVSSSEAPSGASNKADEYRGRHLRVHVKHGEKPSGYGTHHEPRVVDHGPRTTRCELPRGSTT